MVLTTISSSHMLIITHLPNHPTHPHPPLQYRNLGEGGGGEAGNTLGKAKLRRISDGGGKEQSQRGRIPAMGQPQPHRGPDNHPSAPKWLLFQPTSPPPPPHIAQGGGNSCGKALINSVILALFIS